MKITIEANDGTKFNGTVYEDLIKEVNAYESELALKKAKEEEERKAKEEKERKLSQYRITKLKEINEALQKANEELHKANDMVDEYETKTGNKLLYSTAITTGDITIKEVNNTLDFAFNDFYDDFLTLFSKNHR